MARIANDVIGTLLGEAGGKTAAERYRDMLGIASVMANRAVATGQPLQSIVSAPNQFSAYGKSLPKGVEKFEALARMAVEQVTKWGPVNNATYYSTPAATKNLPKGLDPVTATTAHQYFTDPQNRAIGTATGYVAPDTAALAAYAPAAQQSAAPASLTSSAVDIGYAHPERGAWNLGLTPDIDRAVRTLAANTPGGVTVQSGYRSPSINAAVGGAKASQHMHGNAVDLDLSGLSDAERARAVEMARLTGATRQIAYTKEPNLLHVDFAPGYAPNVNTDTYAMVDKSAANLARAPGWFTQGLTQSTVPTPTPRPSPDTAIASLASSPPQTANAAFGSTPSYSAESPASRALAEMAAKSQNTPISEIAGKQIGQPAVAPTDAYATTNLPGYGYEAPAVADIETAATVAPPELDEVAPPPSIAQPAFTPKAIAPAPAPARAPAPSIPSGTKAALDFHAGLNNAAVASNGNTLTRDALGYSYNYSPEFDVTTISNPAGNTVGVKQGKVTADTAASATNASKGIFGLDQDTVSNSVVGGLGGLGGAAVGGLLGPVGSLIGSAIGRQLAVQNNPFATPGTQPSTGLFGLGGLLGGIFGGRGSYPSAPSLAGALGGNQSNRSMGEMRDISPRAAGDISAGRQGLF